MASPSHRDFSWSGRGDSVGRGETDGFSASTGTRGPNGAVPSAGSEIFRLGVPHRRGWVGPPPRARDARDAQRLSVLGAKDVPANVSHAIIAIEDRHFYEHGGFYLPSLLRAAIRNIRAGSTREGGSTITQQLARMTYLSPERSIKRKVQDAIPALWMERQLGDRKPRVAAGLLARRLF